MNGTLILWGVLFGSIGLGFFIYGKKQRKPVPLFCGIGLIIAPYMTDSTTTLLIAGAALTTLPFILRS